MSPVARRPADPAPAATACGHSAAASATRVLRLPLHPHRACSRRTAAHVLLLRTQVTRSPRARLLSPDRCCMLPRELFLSSTPAHPAPLCSLSLPRPRRARQRLRVPRSALSATVRLVRHVCKRAAPCGCLCCALPFAGSSGAHRGSPSSQEGTAVSCEEEGRVRGTMRANGSAWHELGRSRGASSSAPPTRMRGSFGAGDGEGLNAPTEPMAALCGCGTRGCRHASLA